jgi:hypothetical protein
MQQLLDKWERLRRSEYLRPDEKLMLNHCISDLKRFMDLEKADKQQTAVGWFSNQAYELFEQYSEGNFDRITLNKLMVVATNKAKEMDKRHIIKAYQQGVTDEHGDTITFTTEGEDYYNETYGGHK